MCKDRGSERLFLRIYQGLIRRPLFFEMSTKHSLFKNLQLLYKKPEVNLQGCAILNNGGVLNTY